MNEEREHDLNALAAHLEGRLAGEERRRTVEHLGTCLECRETAALLARSWHGMRPADDERAVSQRFAGARPWWIGLAAAAVVATAVAVRLLPTASPGPGPVSTQPSAPAPGPRSASANTEGTIPSPGKVTPTPPSAGATASAIDETLLARRAGGKRVAGKTFRLLRGEWVDMSFEPSAGLPAVDVAGPDQRREILARLPGLAPYLALGDRVVVVFEGTVYRVHAGG